MAQQLQTPPYFYHLQPELYSNCTNWRMISSCVDIKCPVDATKTDLLYSEWLLKAIAVKLEWIKLKTYIRNTKHHLRNEEGGNIASVIIWKLHAWTSSFPEMERQALFSCNTINLQQCDSHPSQSLKWTLRVQTLTKFIQCIFFPIRPPYINPYPIYDRFFFFSEKHHEQFSGPAEIQGQDRDWFPLRHELQP